MGNTVVANQYLLGTQTVPVTGGTGNWCAVCGGPIALALTTTLVGAVSGGTILIEHVDDPQKPLAQAGYASRILADGAAAYWRLNETSGTTAVDQVAGVNGTISGGVTRGVPGPANGSLAMRFDGVSGRVAAPTGAYQTIGIGSASLECWLRFTGVGGGYDIVESGAAPTAATDGLRLVCDATNIQFGTAGGAAWMFASAAVSAAALADKAWRHVVGTYVPGVGSKLYVNGALIATTASSVGAINATVGTAIGSTNAVTRFFPGEIADVAVYKSALTPAQIANHYGLGVGVSQLATIPASGGPGKLITHLAPASYGYVRANITAPITGGAAYVRMAGS